MRERFRRWLDETHGSLAELVRHFLLRFFDNETIAIPGEWQKVAVGIFASLVSVAFCAMAIYRDRYKYLHKAPFLEYQQGVRDDLISFVTLAMAVTALLTILQWQDLFPSRRDCLALAGLPLRPREIFVAKLTALVAVFSAFVVSMTAAPSILFSVLVSGRWQENPSAIIYVAATFAAIAGGCVFVFFALIAFQGLLLHVFPAHTFERVSLFVQASLFILTVGAIPLMGRQPTAALWWPPVWFVRLWEAMVTGPGPLALGAVLAIGAAAAVSGLAYLLSYHRHARILLEERSGHASGRRGERGSRLLERWIGDPREQAAFAFIWKTLFRSRSHRLYLLAYAGVALGWIAKGLIDAPPVKLNNQGLYGLTVVLAPMAISILIAVALRYLFTLPVTLAANWVFQAVEDEDRRAWQSATERFVVWIGIAPVFAAGLPLAIAVLGPMRALAATAMGGMIALLFFERYFRPWRKLPFTCSYLPGKKPVWELMVRGGVGSSLLVPIAHIVLWASAEATSCIALATALAALLWRWRALRLRQWSAAAMLWDEAPPPEVEAIDLRRAKDDDAPLSMGPIRPSREFGETLTASRGLIPAAWAEEIEQERHSRTVWGVLWEDLRYGARTIRRNPLLSAVVVATLTVGIGINASIFTVFSRVALDSHVPDADNFVRFFHTSRLNGDDRPASYPEYLELRDQTRSVRRLAAFRIFTALIGDEDSAGTPGLTVSCNFFVVEGVQRALVGRLLDANDCRAPGQAPVAVIGESVWRQRFQADPNITSRTARINNRLVPIVGVAPDRTSLWVTPNIGVWLPFTSQPYFEREIDSFSGDYLWLYLAGRLAPGYSRRMARAEFQTVAARLDKLTPGRNTVIKTTDGSWIENFELRASGRELFLMTFFFGAFYLVLLIACANVATLLLSRAASRRREIAVRLALGAQRIRLVRMLITESLLLSAAAGAASIFLVHVVPERLFHFISPRSPTLPMTPDWRVFAYIAGIALLTGIGSGLTPALESAKVDLAGAIKGAGGKLSARAGSGGVRGWLVTAQVAMSMLLLVEAALFGQSEDRNLHADPGFLPRHVVFTPLRLPGSMKPEAARARYERIAQRVRATPGVRAVSISDDVPMIGRITIQARPPSRADAIQPIDIYSAGEGFLTTMGVRLIRGRDFNSTDQRAVVISESLARAFFWRSDPVGKTMELPGGPVAIIGIARDVAPLRVGGSDNPALWRSGIAHPTETFLSVRFASPGMAKAGPVNAAIREIEPDLMVVSRNLQGWIDIVTEELWNLVTLIVILGVVATALATAGIYAAVSFAVNQRMRDLGIRVALGATRATIAREVLIMGGKPVARGLLIGAWLSVAMASLLRENLRNFPLRIDSTDPLIYISALILLAAAATTAMIGPAYRASNADPLQALRCE